MFSLLFIPFICYFLFAFIASITGSVLVWKRMSFFSDSISHSLLLGVVISSIMNFNFNIVIGITALLFVLLVFYIKNKSCYEWNIIFNIVTPFFVALSLILNNIYYNPQPIHSYLFGDILLANKGDIISLSILAIIATAWLKCRWNELIILLVNDDIARSSGIKYNKIKLEYLCITALTIAYSIKIVGIMLITAILIIPVTTIGLLSNNPFKMLINVFKLNLFIIIISFLIISWVEISLSPVVIIINILCLLIVLLNRTSN